MGNAMMACAAPSQEMDDDLEARLAALTMDVPEETKMGELGMMACAAPSQKQMKFDAPKPTFDDLIS